MPTSTNFIKASIWKLLRLSLRPYFCVPMALSVFTLGCGGGGAAKGGTEGATIPFAQIVVQSIDLPTSIEPGSSVAGTLHFSASSEDAQTVTLSAIPSNSDFSITLNQSTTSIVAGSGDYSIRFTVQVSASANIGSNGQIDFKLDDKTRAGAVKAFSAQAPIQVSDYTLDWQMLNVTSTGSIAPGSTIVATLDIQAKGPAGTTLALSILCTDPTLGRFTVTPAIINIHAPQVYHCTISFSVSPNALPGAVASFNILGTVGSQVIAKTILVYVDVTPATALPQVAVSEVGIGLNQYFPGSSISYNVTVRSANGFYGPVSLGLAGLSQNVTTSWSSTDFDVPVGGSNAVQLTLAFPPSFVPQQMAPCILVTANGLTQSIPLPLDNLGAPRFTLHASGVIVKAGSIAQMPVTVQSINGFSGPVSLGMDFPLATFSPAVVTLPANGAATSIATIVMPTNANDYMGQYPCTDLAFSVFGESGNTQASASIDIYAMDTPGVVINATSPRADVSVGQSTHWQFQMKSANGYAGTLTLKDASSYGVSTAFSPASVALGPGDVATVDCYSQVTGGDFENQFRADATAGLDIQTDSGSPLASVGRPSAAIWVMDNPNFEVGHPTSVAILPKGKSVTVSVPLESVYNFAGSVSPYAVGASTTGTTTSWDSSYFDMQAGSTTPLSVTLIDAGLSSAYSTPGTYKCMVSLDTPNNAPVGRYATGYFPYVLTDSVTPDFYVIPDRTQVHALTPGTSQVTVRVGSVAGFSGTVHLSLQNAVCGWGFDTPDVALTSGEEKTVTLTLTFGALSGMDMDMPLVGTGPDGTRRPWTLHLMSDPVH